MVKFLNWQHDDGDTAWAVEIGSGRYLTNDDLRSGGSEEYREAIAVFSSREEAEWYASQVA